MSEQYHYCYETVNQINGHYYRGKCSTKDYTLYYPGSGKLLKYALKKHGKENFKTEIIKFFDTSEEAYAFEKKFVVVNTVDPNSYNLMPGGDGGWMEPPNKIPVDVLYEDGRLVRFDAYQNVVGINGEKPSRGYIRDATENGWWDKVNRTSIGKHGIMYVEKVCGDETELTRDEIVDVMDVILERIKQAKLNRSEKHREIAKTGINVLMKNGHTDATKEKNRIASTGRVQSEETKRKSYMNSSRRIPVEVHYMDGRVETYTSMSRVPGVSVWAVETIINGSHKSPERYGILTIKKIKKTSF